MDKNEVRRLEKAARDKNKEKLFEWGNQFENQLRTELEKEYEAKYKKDLQNAIDIFSIAIAYTLHFSESIRMGAKRLPEFMEDLYVTVDMFRTGEYNPDDYSEELKKCGIYLEHVKYGSDNHNLLKNKYDEVKEKMKNK